jgi:phosphoribosylformylglycinamidine synthase
LNCFSELVEESGGTIDISKLPVGDPTLSPREIIGNESQERIGMVIKEEDTGLLKRISERERAPHYIVGETTGDHRFTFINPAGQNPVDLQLKDFFGNPPKTILRDETENTKFKQPEYTVSRLEEYVENVLQLEAVACKDWLTNKVDRSVTGLVAKQQTCGIIQLPLNNLGITALDYTTHKGIATAIGHARPQDHRSVSWWVLSIAEALTNILWAPIEEGIRGISLSANWMWPCRHKGEDARLYAAVKAASEFARALGINIPTGKDSLSMTQKYKDGKEVFSPGTVIISAAGEVSDFRKTVEPVISDRPDSRLLYVDLSGDAFKIGGSCFAQSLSRLGSESPQIKDAVYFAKVFESFQELIGKSHTFRS